MGSVNKVILVGHLGKDPEIRYTQAGMTVANMSLATSEQWTDKAGEKQEKTEWHRLVVWGKLAEVCGEHLAKGRQVYVEGKLQTREWEDGEGVKKYTTEVVVTNVTFLGAKDGGGERPAAQSKPAAAAQPKPVTGSRKHPEQDHGDYGPPPSDDDVPF